MTGNQLRDNKKIELEGFEFVWACGKTINNFIWFVQLHSKHN